MTNTTTSRGFTLIELVVAVGLFAVVMTLASGAYLLMIGLNQRAQGIATGIDNLSFVLETMTRSIRTGTNYGCGVTVPSDCPTDGSSSFTFTPSGSPTPVTYQQGSQPNGNGDITTTDGKILTDPLVNITSLAFFVSGSQPGDPLQPTVTILVSGTVSSGSGDPQSFSVETRATMRGTDI